MIPCNIPCDHIIRLSSGKVSCLQVLLIALPVLIVAIPWAVSHVQLCLAVAAVLALSPFGTVIWSLLSPNSGQPTEQQQQRRPWRSNPASRQSTDRAQPFWPVEVSLHTWHDVCTQHKRPEACLHTYAVLMLDTECMSM